MKKVIIGIFALALGFTANAQEDKYIEANEYRMVYMTEINGGDKEVAVENLLRAKAAIDAASMHENTKVKSKTWKRKFDIYINILTDTSKDARIVALKKDAIDVCIEANELARSVEVDKKGNPKIHEQDQLNILSQVLRYSLFTGATELNKQENYSDAGLMYSKAYRLSKSSKSIDTGAVINTFISYHNAAGDKAEFRKDAIAWGDTIVKMGLNAPEDVNLYSMVARLKLANGDTTQALEVITFGRKLFPTEASFITSQFNIYNQMGNKEKAAESLNEAIVAYKEDPAMLSILFFNMGAIAQSEKRDSEAREFYSKAIEADPKNIGALNNIATTYINEANIIINEMNNLPLKEQKKYNEFKAKAKTLYQEGANYLEKVYEVEKTDKTKNSLYELYNFIDNPEKIKLYE